MNTVKSLRLSLTVAEQNAEINTLVGRELHGPLGEFETLRDEVRQGKRPMSDLSEKVEPKHKWTLPEMLEWWTNRYLETGDVDALQTAEYLEYEINSGRND